MFAQQKRLKVFKYVPKKMNLDQRAFKRMSVVDFKKTKFKETKKIENILQGITFVSALIVACLLQTHFFLNASLILLKRP